MWGIDTSNHITAPLHETIPNAPTLIMHTGATKHSALSPAMPSFVLAYGGGWLHIWDAKE